MVAEASRGLAGKQDHLGDGSAGESAPVAVEGGEFVEVAVGNEHGLHARPAARLVRLVQGFDARVTVMNVTTGKGPVDAGSLSLVATLNAQRGHRLRVGASGAEAGEALAAVRALAERGFDDGPAVVGGAVVVGAGRALGGGSGSGLDVAVGVAIVTGGEVELGGYRAGDGEVERRRLKDALRSVGDQLTVLQGKTAEAVGAAEAEIFDAQLAMLDDLTTLDAVFSAIADGESAPEAWKVAMDAVAARFEELDDAYQRERAQDVRSVRDRVLRVLTGQSETTQAASGLLVVRELDAATAAGVDAERVVGIAVRAAGTTGHGVIVARSRGIPVITGIGDVEVPGGVLVGFDVRAGEFVVEPADGGERLRAVVRERSAERETALVEAERPAVTLDGRTVSVFANVGSVQDAADARGADGSGLVRTEVLFGERRVAPTVDEQVEAFRAIAAAFGGKPITIRTWDVGGDKPLAFLPQEREANPFLGERGIRVFRRRPELLRDQLRAICQVAAETPVQVMFPMVTTADEVAWALQELKAVDPPQGLKVGIMIEVPAAALRIATLAARLDFVSIGTNDLTQYTTASDRGNSAVAGLADGLDPAVLQLIDRVVRGVPEGVEVAVCGDLASDPAAAVLLVGLGVHELSAVGPQVPTIKARLRETDLAAATARAAEALQLASAAEVRAQ
ncbi:phosphoenolpyruvate--protein phosphotransferase [Kribbella sp. NPDC056861]|uniref:phosphoenolpyruvate--protein phosphotransferase n=1 Tax=Kribbella sp. NPDC056861 TaxID=3154857 RepID=UPI0034144785